MAGTGTAAHNEGGQDHSAVAFVSGDQVTPGPPAHVLASLTAYGAGHVVGDRTVRTAHADSHVLVGRRQRGRAERERAQDSQMAPGATRAWGAGDRAVEEAPDPVRTCFEKDRDRILHAAAFRRLAGKTQVVISAASRDDNYRNRLTHAIEVAQVAAAIARPAGLNVALVEAIAFGHDCGHGPTGHASEEAFSPYLPGGFDHAPYGAHVVLEKLNLTAQVIDGIATHSWRLPAASTPEGEVVAFADRIAYVCHDADDAIRAGIITAKSLPEDVRTLAGTDQSSQVGYFIAAVLEGTDLSSYVAISEPAATVLDNFRKFNYEHIYQRPASLRQSEAAIKLLRSLVEYFIDAPGKVPDVASGAVPFPASGSQAAADIAVRYVSSMTDHYAFALAVEQLGWSPDRLPRGI